MPMTKTTIPSNATNFYDTICLPRALTAVGIGTVEVNVTFSGNFVELSRLDKTNSFILL